MLTYRCKIRFPKADPSMLAPVGNLVAELGNLGVSEKDYTRFQVSAIPQSVGPWCHTCSRTWTNDFVQLVVWNGYSM